MLIAYIKRKRSLQEQILRRLNDMATSLDDIIAKVAALNNTSDSVVVLLRSLKAQLDAALASNDPVKIQAVIDAIGEQEQKLAAAVVENTPAAQ